MTSFLYYLCIEFRIPDGIAMAKVHANSLHGDMHHALFVLNHFRHYDTLHRISYEISRAILFSFFSLFWRVDTEYEEIQVAKWIEHSYSHTIIIPRILVDSKRKNF